MERSFSLLYGPSRRRTLQVSAQAWSADMKKKIEFDVTRYLASLSAEDLEEMADADWRGTPNVKGALLWCERGDPVASGLLDYCKWREQSFSVIVDPDEAEDWLLARG